MIYVLDDEKQLTYQITEKRFTKFLMHLAEGGTLPFISFGPVEVARETLPLSIVTPEYAKRVLERPGFKEVVIKIMSDRKVREEMQKQAGENVEAGLFDTRSDLEREHDRLMGRETDSDPV